MADNVELDAGSGGATLATDDVGGVHYQIGKLAFGALDSATLASSGAGNVDAGTQRVTLAADDPAVVDLAAIEIATEATQAAVEILDNAAYVDDADWTDGTSYHLLVGGLYQSTPQTVTDGDVAPFNITANGALHVAQQGTVTVSGTVTANLSATDNGVLDNIDADTSAIQTATEAIQAAVEGTLTVGSHAVTNAGTFAVQESGDALTALQLVDDVVYVDDADWTDGTSKHALVGGLYQSSPQTVTDGDVAPFNITANGALHVAQQGTVTVDLGANNDVTVTGTVDLGATDNAVLDAIAASVAAIDTDATTIIGHVDGIEGLLTTIDSDTGGILTAVQLIDNAINGNEMQVDVVGALPAGTNNIGDVDVLSIAAGTNSIGNVGLVPRTSGGMSIFRSIDIDESEEDVKTSAGQVFSITAFNRTAAPLYLKFYNATAANVTVGTTTPALTFVVPGNADSDGAGFVWNNTIGFAFSTAISVACTTGVADNDTGAPGANDCIVIVGYA